VRFSLSRSPQRRSRPTRRVSHGVGFWLVAYSFTVVMALSALPTPLYVLYAARDGFSTLMITVVFAAYAAGVLASLVLAGHISDWYGRRRILIPATATAAVAAAVFMASPSLPALIAGRTLSGLAVGMVTTTATAHLGDLHNRRRPGSAPQKAQLVAVAANLGGIGLGPLVSGLLAQFVPHPLVVPYVVFEVLLVVAVLAFVVIPETAMAPDSPVRYRPQHIAVPPEARGRFVWAAAGGFVVFAIFGLFTSVAPSFLAESLHDPSHALAGAVTFAVFAAAALSQIALRTLSVRQALVVGRLVAPVGLGLLAAGAWAASLTMFISGSITIGAGAGLLFKGMLSTSIEVAPARSRAEVLAAFFVAAYLGLTIPVVTIGALRSVLSAQVITVGFAAIAIALILPVTSALIDHSGPARLTRRPPGRPVSEAA